MSTPVAPIQTALQRLSAAGAVTLGAFLLFLVQPIVARALLPRFGGTAVVWSSSVLCFQAVLLCGYTYAHAARRWPSGVRRGVHLALLAGAAACLPVSLGASAAPLTTTGAPALDVIRAVLGSVGLPAFLLSTTGPHVARVLGGAPYRLYALSNAASLAALLAYPTLLEPNLSLSSQGLVFSGLFAVYAICVAALVLGDKSPTTPRFARDSAAARPPWVRWLVLSAVPSGLFLAVTQHLCVNVAPVPLLWVLPLSIYLVTLVLCFDHPRWYRRGLFVGALPVALFALGVSQIELLGHTSLVAQLAPALSALFVACMAAHGELAAIRPTEPGLTGFYLAVALGGVLGGAFVSLGAPEIFNGPAELPLLLLATGVAVLWAWRNRPPAAAHLERLVTAGLSLFLGLFAMVAWSMDRSVSDRSLIRVRDAYASLRVAETPVGGDTVRSLIHGTIRHGAHRTSEARRHETTTYYRPSSGIGRALLAARTRGPVKLGVVGLGTGSLADWLRPGDAARFYELDPQVETVARAWFWALPEARAPVDVVLGDGRLSLDAEPPQGYDVLALDAFNSDAVPTHLLTREAFAIYRRHLATGGVLAVHISNHYVNLEPTLAAEVGDGAWDARLFEDAAGEDVMAYASKWVLLAEPGRGAFDGAIFAGGRAPVRTEGDPPAFTDERTSLWSMLRWE